MNRTIKKGALERPRDGLQEEQVKTSSARASAVAFRKFVF